MTLGNDKNSTLAVLIDADNASASIAPCVRVVVASNEAAQDECKIQSVVQTASD